MFRDIFTNRLFMGAFAFFILCVAGSLLYMHHENQKGSEYAAGTQNSVRQWNAKQNPTPTETEAPVGGTSQGGHFHEDVTSQEGVHVPVPSASHFASDTGLQSPRCPSL